MLVNELHQGGILALIDYDHTIFDNMVLPVDDNNVEVVTLQDVVDHILLKYGNAPLFTPEPAVMKYYIAAWSRRRKSLWERFYRAAIADYSPIENYDRTEKTTDYLTHGHTVTTDDDLTNGLTVESQISADNASTYQPDRKNINSGKDQRDISEKHTGIDKRDYDSHIHGNIGVTTAQQMITAEIDLIPKLDLIDFIADDWHEEFNLMIY